LTLTTDIPDKLPRILGDRQQLKQAFINLLNNAVKFNQRDGNIHLEAVVKKNLITISVSDTGLGIPKDEHPYIFEKFYRVKAHREQVPGTGLGLSVVKQIITGHGGEISFTSDPDTGSTFTVTLPSLG
jgi:two-component system phosphate regulon sensor histidine kinase PhoR